ncbi:uncharacterized protein LOC112506979 isoform X2 [Cynara cardunculus var. scolymus]|uniref:uncharacterized protein LOC112506979 isoform X2 n=1 Tax=Cynara cardunculus var. scolymus TaxID=59895 RepID=UPI000D6255A2|nr:uncharacterized protein LOC112506979 isoform X2 [Cynara cardunculus var. scolymus]
MLHKSFKPAKCKTSLKLAISRIKLMKNKKGVQINQMKRDLSQLLDTGQDRTARIRVEHVIREEKMVAAYELIEIYCELIVSRMPIIESQKICPMDLKEAVTSVIFAAPRCSDISELSDIRKHFTRKYGKEFISAATELRPDCGVSRLLVEKLSAVAPDLQTKIKVLSDVAKEHNIKWDPTSFEEKESKPTSDLLNGPSSFEKIGMTTVDPPKTQASNSDVVHSRKEKQDAPIDFAQQNRKYTLDTRNTTSTDNVGVETSSAATHADMRSSGVTSERMEMRQPVPRGNNDFSSGRENWNMEFKDATSAAQAAAESAERAAMAARAAAQFSRDEKIVKQYPTGSHVSDIRDEASRVSAPSGFTGEHHSRDLNESSSHDRKPKMLNQKTDRSEHNTSKKATERFAGDSHGGNSRSSMPTSFRSNNDSIEDEKLVNNFHMADGYFEESLNQDQDPDPDPPHPKMTTSEGFEESKAELASGKKDSSESEDINCFAEESTKTQPTHGSSHSTSDELEVPDHQKFTKRSVVGNPFAAVGERNLFAKTNSNLDSGRDDEAISDDDGGGPRFDTGFEDDEVSPTRSLENDQMWNKSNTIEQVSSQSPLFSESVSFPDHSVKYTAPLETDDHILANFDRSDGPDSESETDLFSTNPEPLSLESKQDFNSRKNRIELNDLVEKESSFFNPEDEEKDQESVDTFEGGKNDSLNQSNDLDARKELNFGTLTGGLRNKGGLRYPPYTKSPVSNASDLYKKSVEESSVTGGETSGLDSLPVQSSEKASKQANTRSRYPSSAAFFDDDEGTDSEKEEMVLKQASSRVRLGSGVSRRTRGPPAPKTVISSSSDYKKPSQNSYSDDDLDEPRSYARRFEEVAKQIPESRQTFIPARKTTEIGSTAAQERTSNRSYGDEIPSVNLKEEVVETIREHKIPTRKPARSINTVESGKTKITRGSPSVPYSKSHVDPVHEPETVVSGSVPFSDEPSSPRTSGESGGTTSLVKKAIHVHPKLPDYDSIAARLESLRTSRP